MPSIEFILQTGEKRTVDVAAGTTVLSAAIKHGIDGLLGDCGGVCMCATCHIYIENGCLDRLPPVQDVEEAVLEVTNAERLGNSRLGCQIKVTDALDGLVVRVPPSQR